MAYRSTIRNGETSGGDSVIQKILIKLRDESAKAPISRGTYEVYLTLTAAAS